jgi:16S rRNA (cytidine1402-2'-O)-methyltransferase
LARKSLSHASEREPSGAAGREQAPVAPLAPGLYLVATPIGNLRDITLRALDALAGADLIACEDTRVTRKLLDRYAIDTKTLAYNDHNARRILPRLIERLKDGESVALVSDAGTPLVSDPGYRLVAAAVAEDIPVHALPGPSAALAALVLAGLPTDAFFFAGFLPAKSAARRRRIGEIAGVPGSLVLFESAQRIADCLADLAAELGDRPAAVAREITKLHEEVVRGDLPELAAHYAATDPPRGEIVVVVGPPAEAVADDDTVRAALEHALTVASVRDAVDAVARETGRARREVYRMALALAGDDGAADHDIEDAGPEDAGPEDDGPEDAQDG